MKREKKQYDEFYTAYDVVKKGVEEFKSYFKNKIVYCNCDDYRKSNFVKYFSENFDALGLKALIATSYEQNDRGRKYVRRRNNIKYVKRLNGDGSFDSDECIRILKSSDICCTNPPFSKKEEIINLILEHNKKMLLLLPQTTMTIKSVAERVMNNEVWFSQAILKGGVEFEIPSEYEHTAAQKRTDNGKRYITISGIKWITNIDYKNRYKDFSTGKTYASGKYQRYDNLDAIDIKNINDIPDNYFEPMGVPVTFLAYCNPQHFSFLGVRKGNDGKDLRINGKEQFTRYIVQRVG